MKDLIVPIEPDDVKPTWASKAIVFIISAAIVLTAVFYGTVHQPILALFYLSAALLVILWAADAWFSGVLRFNRSWLQLPFIAAVIFGAVQIIPFGTFTTDGVSGIARTISEDPYATQIATLHWAALLIYLAVTLSFLDSTRRLRKVFYVITIFGFIFAFFAIIQAVLSPTKIYGIYEPRALARPFGSFVNPNNFAAYMEMTIALPLGLLFAGAVEKDKKLLYITAIALMGIALVLSGSRGGFISLVAEVLFLVILTFKTGSQGKLVRLASAGALLLCIIIGTFFLGAEKSSLTRFTEETQKNDQATTRTHIWKATLGIFAQNPVFGSGLNAFGIAYTAQDTLSGAERAEQAHNDYLQVLADAGLIGGAIGIFFLIAMFRTGLESVKTHSRFRRGLAVGAFAGLFAVLVHSVFDFVLHTTAIAVLFIVLLALMVNARKDETEEPIERERKRRSSRDNVKPLRRREELPG